jgi:S-adenosylmethionine synthetase
MNYIEANKIIDGLTTLGAKAFLLTPDPEVKEDIKAFALNQEYDMRLLLAAQHIKRVVSTEDEKTSGEFTVHEEQLAALIFEILLYGYRKGLSVPAATVDLIDFLTKNQNTKS